MATSWLNCSGTFNKLSSSGPNPADAGQVPVGAAAPFALPLAVPLTSVEEPFFFLFFVALGPSFFCSLVYSVLMFLSMESRRSIYS